MYICLLLFFTLSSNSITSVTSLIGIIRIVFTRNKFVLLFIYIYILSGKSYGITDTVSVCVNFLLDLQTMPIVLMEFFCQTIMYKCLAPLVFKKKIFLPFCSCYVRLTWSTEKAVFHSHIVTLHTTIAAEKNECQMTKTYGAWIGHVITSERPELYVALGGQLDVIRQIGRRGIHVLDLNWHLIPDVFYLGSCLNS